MMLADAAWIDTGEEIEREVHIKPKSDKELAEELKKMWKL